MCEYSKMVNVLAFKAPVLSLTTGLSVETGLSIDLYEIHVDNWFPGTL